MRIRRLKVTLIQEAIMQQREALFTTGTTAESLKHRGDLAAAVRQALPNEAKKYSNFKLLAISDAPVLAVAMPCCAGGLPR